MFLDGCIASFTKAYGPFFLENRLNEANFYIEDNWRVRPSLTINPIPLRIHLGPERSRGPHWHGIKADSNMSHDWAWRGLYPRRATGWVL
jgi:hypothetical protein